jgi:bromodomain and WD repeat domain-containing protein 1/3
MLKINLFYRSKRLVPASGDWRMRCREVLQLIWNHDDSEPFREPVDIVEHPGKLKKLLARFKIF